MTQPNKSPRRNLRTRERIEHLLAELACDRRLPVDRRRGLALAGEAVALSEKIGWREGSAGALLQLARYQEPAEALETNLRALLLFQRLRDREGEAAALNNISLVYRQQGLTTIAQVTGARACRMLDDEGMAADAIANLASIHATAGSIELALSIGAEAIQRCRKEERFRRALPG